MKKNGLYGWKMVVEDPPTSTNIHKKKINAQPTSTQKLDSNSQQNIFEKWLVSLKPKMEGGGLESDNFGVFISANSTKIIKNNSYKNIRTSVFNNTEPDDKYPTKTDQD